MVGGSPVGSALLVRSIIDASAPLIFIPTALQGPLLIENCTRQKCVHKAFAIGGESVNIDPYILTESFVEKFLMATSSTRVYSSKKGTGHTQEEIKSQYFQAGEGLPNAG